MSIKTQENLKGDAEQQRRQDLAKETVDRIISETPRQISMEMYARSIAFEAYAAGWNNKADEVRPPEPMILHCPNCRTQHIDKATPHTCESCGHPESEHWKEDADEDAGCYLCGFFIKGACKGFVAWLNPPHRKHRCHNCNYVWKPSLLATTGVESLENNGGE